MLVAVDADLERLGVDAASSATAQIARVLARVLDEPGVPATARVTAARQLLDALGQLRGAGTGPAAPAAEEDEDGISRIGRGRAARLAAGPRAAGAQ